MSIHNNITHHIKRIFKKIIGENVVTSLVVDNSLCPIYNINQTVNINQKRLAFVYIRSAWDYPMLMDSIYHPNLIHQTAIINVFCQLGYCVDIYSCLPEKICTKKINYENRYDIIFGFGIQFIQLCKSNLNALKILFVTENSPWVVRRKYAERLSYFKKRHPDLILNDSSRTEFYTDEMFSISDYGIAITGTYNLCGIKQRLPKVQRLNVNGLLNKSFNIVNRKDHSQTRTHFVWFGSRGVVHKGLDILIDAFAELPQLSLDVYGVDKNEIVGFKLPKNVMLCGTINVLDDSFIINVVERNTFVVSLSCSEGMQTGITTCMMHGLIPIVTKECGLDDQPEVLYFENYDINTVKNVLLSASEMSICELRKKEIKVYEKSISDFSIENFTINFEKCFRNLLNDELSKDIHSNSSI